MYAVRVIAAALVLTLGGSAVAQTNQYFSLSRTGSVSCAHWLHDTTTENLGNVWIYGFWTAANAIGADHFVGHTFHGQGVLDEIKKFCRENPSEELVEATAAVYNKMMMNNQ